ncbi:hypothetical protein LAV_00054 [Sphingobium phage Lacusarx]|uniref:Uncharacterized protein n=1 Tax=Sphingobium phage Lacusarx TaxID=1980139 RepID=A0A1W6DX20_9CAUD|nr:hypothetical protein FDH44_gp054 [Sphingobium phage Lacusarx]ARK07454.1 hypothetical protein LAV_00054 [Sphingobium phage Lacusarx]
MIHDQDLSTPEGYAIAYAAEVLRSGDPIPARDIELFYLLQEECGEVIQERSKLHRSSERANFRKLSDPDGPTVMQRFISEVYDVMTLFSLMSERGYISQEGYDAHRAGKLARLRIYSPEIF